MVPPPRATAVAAALAGAPILVSFFVWHWYNIVPTWGVLIEAAVAYPLGIWGISWAWRVSRAKGRFVSAWGGVLFSLPFVAGLVVEEAIGLARGRAGPLDTGAAIAAEVGLASLALIPALLVGWHIARGRGAGAFALAALPLDLHLGGTIMHMGGVGPALLLFWLLVAAYLFAGVVLPRAEAALASRFGAAPQSGTNAAP